MTKCAKGPGKCPFYCWGFGCLEGYDNDEEEDNMDIQLDFTEDTETPILNVIKKWEQLIFNTPVPYEADEEWQEFSANVDGEEITHIKWVNADLHVRYALGEEAVFTNAFPI